jgi:isoleucyl-tRNA synthetase
MISLWTLNPKDNKIFEKFRDSILSELNVKDMEILTELSEGFRLKLVLDYRKLGPKLKKDLARIQKETEKYSQEKLKELYDKRKKITIELEQEQFALDSDEYHISIEDKEGFSSIVEENVGVILDLTLSEELKIEGYARDIVRNIQKMRQDLDLEITEEISVTIQTSTAGSTILKSLEKYSDYIAEETLATNLRFGASSDKPLKEQRLDLDFTIVTIRISK